MVVVWVDTFWRPSDSAIAVNVSVKVLVRPYILSRIVSIIEGESEIERVIV